MIKEEAQLLFKLAKRKGGCWGGKYERLEHLKRFPNLKQIVKEFSNKGWIIIHKKPNFTAISLNTKYKKEIIEFVEREVPYVRGIIK